MSYANDPQPQSPTDEIFGEVISTYTDAQAPRTAICNILVKYVRMYGFDHKRTAGQFEIA